MAGIALAGLFAGLGAFFGAGETASGVKSAADTTAAAADTAASDQAASAAAALAFEKAQAEQTYQQQQTTAQANYGQYTAQQTAYNQVREQLGLPALPIPDYTPIPDPGFTSASSAPAASTTPGAAPTVPTPATTVPSVKQVLQPGASPSPTATPTPSATAGASGAAGAQSALLTALNGGQSGQALVDQINAQYGLQPGSSLMYQASTNTYALPSGYAAIGPNGQWGWTARAGSGTSASGAAPAALVAGIPAPSTTAAAPLPPALSAPGAVNPQNVGYYLSQFGGA